MATMDNDAKACYDRIIMSLATIVSGSYGLPRNTRKLQAKVIRAMQFHIKTALGVSREYYQDSPTTPLHGSKWICLYTVAIHKLDSDDNIPRLGGQNANY
jgi:hypothetical protein